MAIRPVPALTLLLTPPTWIMGPMHGLGQAKRSSPASCSHSLPCADRSVILRHPENWKLIRIYAKFVEFIKNDPYSAAKWNA